ncbi:MAG: phosphoribosylamine--glycine ligase [Bacteroidales bacterium]|jgi:phosphoribosylamine--glycine ligase|nr:phosphoribosylamine--glycine ligase [Bacteroidales bacterium]
MNVLILGSGGREHALAWKIAQSKLLDKLYVAPGNAGTLQIAENVPLNILNFEEISEFIISNKVDMLVVGPEDPLVNGIVDFFSIRPEHNNLMVIGPGKDGAQLEGSKDFAKKFMQKYNIPTARYHTATNENLEESIEFLKTLDPPFVLKADGLAAGKGVLILNDFEETVSELKNILEGKFGNAGSKVVIEEYMDGVECSVFVITDGRSYKILPEAKDYKRIGENNTGLNTGGMGAVSPVSFYDEQFAAKVENSIIKPTIHGIKEENMDYKGFIFFGLINIKGNPYVIEYNVRMGDPETEVVIPRIESDLLPVLMSVSGKELENENIRVDARAVSTVMLVSGGYPEEYEKGKVIYGLDNVTESIVFHAGTSVKDSENVTSGGRVLAVSSYGDNIFEALEKSYKSIKKIKFDKMYYRKDLGNDLKK